MKMLPVTNLLRVVDDQQTTTDGMSRILQRIDPPGHQLVVLEVFFVPFKLRGWITTSKATERYIIDEISTRQVKHNRRRLLNKIWSSGYLGYVSHFDAILKIPVFNIKEIHLQQ